MAEACAKPRLAHMPACGSGCAAAPTLTATTSVEGILRLSELVGLGLGDVSPASREATVTGKGDRQRTVRFTYGTARALDRYSRERARHPMARVRALWLGVRGGPMTASGVYQMIERRGRQAGVAVSPHKFRHTFSHTWTGAGRRVT